MAAKKNKTSFFCTSCGYQCAKWLGKCPGCNEWDTMQEAPTDTAPTEAHETPQMIAAITELGEVAQAIPISKIVESEQPRQSTGIGEFDRVLGGGVVTGSVVLVGGDPGIGKSTLLLQVLDQLSKPEQTTLYVSGEESPVQSKMRSRRMGINNDELYFLAASGIEEIIKHFRQLKPKTLVIDSIQTCHSPEIKSPPGTTSQVRQSAAHLVKIAKSTNTPIFIIGHVTKDGAIAGPKLLEHMVDTVLYFESDTQYPYRILRAVKNRFGSTNEIGVFEMTGSGLIGVESPSSIFLNERPQNLAGSLVSATIEGTRPILTEIQALVSTAVSGGIPRRTTLGIDRNRAALMIAIMEKRLRLNFSNKDIFLNIVGGLKVIEPAIDLALVAAILSSHLDQIIPTTTIVIGEVGLTGEIRRVNMIEQRLSESLKFGFKKIIIPQGNLSSTQTSNKDYVKEISTLQELAAALFS
ncbi:MAG: DNA repair protein RadA [Deltaproteobacteria bacterium]|nr:DNA repair protein RadA [Candidatus Tharpella aukensis]